MDQAQPVGRIDVISDAICPWCYIGKRHLEGALKILEKDKLHFNVFWNPFQLNPDMPAEGVDRQKYREAKFGGPERAKQIDERITETARGVGIEFHLERLTRTPNTVNAHRLIRMAGQAGVQDAVVEAMFDAYFCNGADVGDAHEASRGGVLADRRQRRLHQRLRSAQGLRVHSRSVVPYGQESSILLFLMLLLL